MHKNRDVAPLRRRLNKVQYVDNFRGLKESVSGFHVKLPAPCECLESTKSLITEHSSPWITHTAHRLSSIVIFVFAFVFVCFFATFSHKLLAHTLNSKNQGTEKHNKTQIHCQKFVPSVIRMEQDLLDSMLRT